MSELTANIRKDADVMLRKRQCIDRVHVMHSSICFIGTYPPKKKSFWVHSRLLRCDTYDIIQQYSSLLSSASFWSPAVYCYTSMFPKF